MGIVLPITEKKSVGKESKLEHEIKKFFCFFHKVKIDVRVKVSFSE